ncbi:hypothetical protein C2S51_019952 [Perilla frutescens var. frutescens]|nr:hypothetical protein C2S51_019952 [Perilla frutescens var. frutescens]
MCPSVQRDHRTVSFYLHHDSWHVDRLHSLCAHYDLPAELEDSLKAVPILWGELDAPRWNLAPHDEFSLTSAWECVRHRAPRRALLADFWSDCLTPTISIFLWRLYFDRIPVDAKILAREIPLVSRCHCCSVPSTESVPHLFLQRESVQAVWMHFSSWFHITPPHFTHISHALSFWRHLIPCATHRHICFLIPCLILWFTWTERNDRKHRGRPFRSSHIIFQVTRHLHQLVLSGKLLPSQWAGCFPQVHFMPAVETVRRPLRSRAVTWQPLSEPWVKLKSDGSFDRAQQTAAGAGYLEIIVVSCSPPIVSRCRPIPVLRRSSGLSYRGSSSFPRRLPMFGSSSTQRLWSQSSHLVLEVRDNLGKSSPDYVFYYETVMFESHIHREGNRPADFLARLGHEVDGLHIFYAQTAPRPLASLVRMDQLGYPNFRFRR